MRVRKQSISLLKHTNLLQSNWKKDDEWAMVVDLLNEQLHTEHTLSGSCHL